MRYIQRKDPNGLETVDEFDTYKEAREMVKEYRMSDRSAEFYISTRPCNDWKIAHLTTPQPETTKS